MPLPALRGVGFCADKFHPKPDNQYNFQRDFEPDNDFDWK